MAEQHRPTLTKLALGPHDNDVYVLSCPITSHAVIIDAAAEPERIVEACRGLDVIAILTTHGHFDHIGAVEPVRSTLGIPFRLHPADAEIAGMVPDEPLVDGEEVAVGEMSVRVVHTPGHTPGSVCFVVEAGELHPHLLFSGDTLFPGGPGATRWDYSDFDQIMGSLDERLFVLPDDTVVHPGHGPDTTLGTERPHLEEWRARRW